MISLIAYVVPSTHRTIFRRCHRNVDVQINIPLYIWDVPVKLFNGSHKTSTLLTAVSFLTKRHVCKTKQKCAYSYLLTTL